MLEEVLHSLAVANAQPHKQTHFMAEGEGMIRGLAVRLPIL